MEYDDKSQPGVDQFMDFSEEEEKPVVPSENYDPGSKFLQKGLNAFNRVAGQPMLKEDGNMGPKTQANLQTMIKSLPPELKRWAVNKAYKEMNKTEGDGGAGNNEGFQSPNAADSPPPDENPFV